MKKTQRTDNPYKNTDTNKRYYTYDYYLRKKYGTKVAKIPLDLGLTCPNIDGKCGVGGCIYCSDRGSGDFAKEATMPLKEQYEAVRKELSSKWNTEKCIAYFQAHTNTYAPVEFLREKFFEVLSFEGVVGINIATRADCLPVAVCELIRELSEKTNVTVELGLQSSNDGTAKRINRGHTFGDFKEGYERLKKIAPKAEACIHIIFGLPQETEELMLCTVRDVAELAPEQVKIHLLHVLKNTALASLYEKGEYQPLLKEGYVSLVADAIEFLPSDTVVARVTGDGMGSELIAPEWSRKKVSVINDIDKLLYERESFQGKNFRE